MLQAEVQARPDVLGPLELSCTPSIMIAEGSDVKSDFSYLFTVLTWSQEDAGREIQRPL